jgi:hypothetical protein
VPATPVITQLVELYDVPALADGETLVREGGDLVAVTVVPAGGARVLDQTLNEWASAEAFEPSGTISRDGNDVVTTTDVVWPDGSAGVFTTTATDPGSGAIDAYTITHVDSGKTVTQAAVTRNADGAVTVKPALVVS